MNLKNYLNESVAIKISDSFYQDHVERICLLKMIGNTLKEKILITGGTGFLGSSVVKSLLSHGSFPTVLARNLSAGFPQNVEQKFNFVEIDMLNTNDLKNFLEKFRPKVIVHLAGYTFNPEDDANALEKFNFEVTAKLLDLAQSIDVKRVVLTGSADEYGFQSCPQKETAQTIPVSDYAISKNKAVKYALSLYEKYKFPVVILRPFTVYGEDQPAKMFVSQAIKCAVKNMPFEMSEGKQKRDLVYITDFADAIIKAITVKNIEGEVFNVGSGSSIALSELAKKIWVLAGADYKLLKIGARFAKENELHNTEADITKIKKTLNWEPKITLDEGLSVIIEKAKNNLK